MKILILAITLLTSISCTSQSSEYATARIIDVYFSGNPKIIVAYGDTDSEIIELNQFSLQNLTPNNDDAINEPMAKNLKIINKFLSSMDQKGYKIEQMSTGVNEGHFTFIIFRKKSNG